MAWRLRANHLALLLPAVFAWPAFAKSDWAAKIKLTEQPGAKHYDLEVVKVLSEKEKSPPQVFQGETSTVTVPIEPGSYETRSRAYFGDKPGEWSATTVFYVPFQNAQIQSPKEGETVEAVGKEKTPVLVKWKSVAGATGYNVFLFDTKGFITDRRQVKETQHTFYLPTGASHRVLVRPFNYGGEDALADASQARHFSTGVLFDDHFDNQPAEEPAHFYGWASWEFSNVDYVSQNVDNNSLTTDKIPGGSLNLATGYWHRKSRFGVLGFADISEFEMESKRYVYSTFGVLGGRRFELNDRYRMRLWAGLGHKEMPELVTEPGNTYLRVQDIGSYGYYGEVTLIGPLYENFKWFLLANYYRSLMSSQTPNGLPLDVMDSYQYGAYISHPLGEGFRARAGIAYRRDDSKYDSFQTGQSNLVEIKGTYVSLIFEFSLQSSKDMDD